MKDSTAIFFILSVTGLYSGWLLLTVAYPIVGFSVPLVGMLLWAMYLHQHGE